MVSKKAQMLEASLQEDMHPFAARVAVTPPSQPEKPTTTSKNSVLTRLNPAKSSETSETDHNAMVENKQVKKQVQQTSNIANNIAILQLSNEDIEDLKEPSYQPQTYRLSEREIDWIKDTAYRLSKEIRRGKVSQVDILRIAIKLFENLLATNKAELIEILERIK